MAEYDEGRTFYSQGNCSRQKRATKVHLNERGLSTVSWSLYMCRGRSIIGSYIVWMFAGFTETTEYTLYRCALFRLCVFLMKFCFLIYVHCFIEMPRSCIVVEFMTYLHLLTRSLKRLTKNLMMMAMVIMK